MISGRLRRLDAKPYPAAGKHLGRGGAAAPGVPLRGPERRPVSRCIVGHDFFTGPMAGLDLSISWTPRIDVISRTCKLFEARACGPSSGHFGHASSGLSD